MSDKKEKLTRREMREAAFLLLYQVELNGGSKADLGTITLDCVETFGLVLNSASVRLAEGVLDNKAVLDEIIGRYSSVRKVERIPKINLTIMRMGLYEMDFMPEIPDKVAMNEAIELSKDYAYPPDSKLISGLLGSRYKDKYKTKNGTNPCRGESGVPQDGEDE
ncbi:MAG: transcription antitermination factor NusB [Oscillospiraceae bacterium]|jgi:N utilization substance protein B|nr:transcription antitermination factor NusB [Oscillospiraceae bacterium]